MSARREALSVLTACRVRGAWADAALGPRLAGLAPADAGLCSRIVYGVIQNEALLDFYLSRYCTQKLERLQPPLADILRIGAYQILFLDRVPDSAAVHTSVELAKGAGRGPAAGLVNAVLRRLSREKDALPDLPAEDRAEYLALRYSHPLWLTRRLIALLGDEEAEAYLRLDNAAVPTVIQRNPLRCTAGELTESLREDGVSLTPHSWLPDCWQISGGGSPEDMPAFRQGWFQVQDAAARAAVLAAGLKPGDRVLDVCAAPGGKSFAAAMAMEDRGEIVACDIHRHKLELIEKGAERLGLQCVRPALADGRETREEWREGFDAVLCDVPCSGLGIIRKKPDVRYKDPALLAGLPAVQRAILDNARRYVKPGGVLLYATCTILPEENQDVTEDFLSRRDEFRREGFSLPGGKEAEDGSLTLWPQRHGTDGFYICRMRRS